MLYNDRLVTDAVKNVQAQNISLYMCGDICMILSQAVFYFREADTFIG